MPEVPLHFFFSSCFQKINSYVLFIQTIYSSEWTKPFKVILFGILIVWISSKYHHNEQQIKKNSFFKGKICCFI